MRSLVAGGAGFIGSALCRRLLERGDTVWCVDNLSTGRIENIKPLVSHDRFGFLEYDITRGFSLPRQIDAFYNLACPASPVAYQRDPVGTMRTSVLGTLNLLEAARARRARFLQASTSEIYGCPAEHPQRETYWGHVNPTGPRACYDEGKRAAEALCFDYQRQHGFPAKVVRIFNTYGPRMAPDDGRVVSEFITRSLRGLPFVVHGTGEQTRSFCYIEDLVAGLIRMMEAPAEVSGPINLGNPHEITIIDLIRAVRLATGSVASVSFQPAREDDPPRRCPDISQARALLGWNPVVPLDEGVALTVAYFRREGEVA